MRPGTDPSPAALAAVFRRAREAWAAAPWPVHLAAVLTLAALPLVRWGWLLADLPLYLTDELPYRDAFDALLAGENPYHDTDYLYPSVFALAGAALQARTSQELVVGLLRGANLLGLGVAVWASLAWLPLSLARRWLAGAVFILVAPQVNFGVLLGNFSLAVCGVSLGALAVWRRAPLAAGALFGVGVALKPMAALVLPALVLYRSPEGDSRLARGAVAGLATAAALTLGFPYRAEFLSLTSNWRLLQTVTLHRFPALFSWDINALWISVPVALAFFAYLYRRPLAWSHFLFAALTATLAFTPLVWSHTLLLVLPLQIAALTVAWVRYRAARAAAVPGSGPLWELVFVLLAVSGIQFAAGAATITDQSLALQAAAAAIPALSPLALTVYVLRTTDPF